MRALRERIADGERLVSDGAMGSLLLARGLRLGECPEAVNLSHPEWIAEITRAYVDAGADLVQTNTFGASPLKLAPYGLDAETERINARAVEIAREAAAGRASVVASCGPSGRLLEPYGDTNPDEVRASFRRQAAALAAAGADAILVETMTDLAEALLALEAARDAAPALPVLVTLTFDDTPRGFFTLMGNSVEQAARTLEAAGADAVGSNCGNGVETMTRVARELRRVSSAPLVIQSNAGLPALVDGVLTYLEPPDLFEAATREMLSAGVTIVGGCCGTTPDYVRAIRRAVDAAR
jgi:5-methyltetrahydrofolate--homocysteine methyltransferase